MITSERIVDFFTFGRYNVKCRVGDCPTKSRFIKDGKTVNKEWKRLYEEAIFKYIKN